MASWRISICKQQGDGSRPVFPAATGAQLATWQTGWRGLDWINGLVARGQAAELGGVGFPLQFAAQAEHLREPILAGPPDASPFWIIPEGSVFVGTPPASPTHVDEAALRACEDGEWLIIDAWDES